MRHGGDSYYVLVNNKNEEYTVDDIIEGEYIVDFDSWEEAEDELRYLIEDGELDAADGWHVERARW
jgi:hypothetical protein